MMKKIILALLAVLLIFCAVACNDAADPKLFIKAPKTITIKAKNGNTNLKVGTDSIPVANGKTEWEAAGLEAVTVTYTGTTSAGASYNSTDKPTDKGTYKATMTVAGGSESVTYDFEITN